VVCVVGIFVYNNVSMLVLWQQLPLHRFLLCDAMLTWYMLWACVCLSVFLHVCHISTFWSQKIRHSKSSMCWCGQHTRWQSASGLHLWWLSASWLNAQVYYTLVFCNPLTPLLRFVPNLSFSLFLHCYTAVGKILMDTSLCMVYLR